MEKGEEEKPVNDELFNQFVNKYLYALCPGCGKTISLTIPNRFKRHKKNDGRVCPYSNHVIQGKMAEYKKDLKEIRRRAGNG